MKLPLLLFCTSLALQAHIDVLLPAQITAGGGAFTLRVVGSDIEPGEMLLWNSTPLATNYVGSGELRATIPAELIRNPGTVFVTLAGYNSLPFIVNPPLQITSTSPLPDAPLGAAYSHRLLGTGGTTPHAWEISAGSLPDGLALARTTGVISGTPRVSGTSSFTVRLSDAALAAVTKPFTITVGGTGPGTGPPTCQVSPQNTFLPIHHPDNHLPGRGYPDHLVRVVSLPGLQVTLTATRAAFPGTPPRSSATSTTDASGTAVFVVNPPAATASDRTDLTATARRGSDAIECGGSIVVGVGTLTALANGAGASSTALLERLRKQLDTDNARFSDELIQIVLRDPNLEAGAQDAVARFLPVLTAALDGQSIKLRPGELKALDQLTRIIDRQASPGLRQVIRQWRAELFTLAGRVENTPSIAPEWRPMKSAQPQAAREVLARRAVSFEAGDSAFLLRGAAHAAMLSDDGVAMVSPKSGLVRMRLDGRRRWPKPVGIGPLAIRSNYIRGKQPSAWRIGVPHYEKVRYAGVYPGTDLIFYGDHGQLRYDFVLNPGARPDRIALSFDGALAIEPEDNGELVLHHSNGTTRLGTPVVYQDIAGSRRLIAAHYVKRHNGAIGFEVADYDRRLPLVIDPVLAYAGFAGGAQDDAGLAIAVDRQGSAYVAGFTASADFPGARSLQPAGSRPAAGNVQAFVTKFTPDGSGVVYTTYFGGDGLDVATALAVDTTGSVYVGGSTSSANFPVLQPIQPTFAGGSHETGGDGFVLKLDPSGSALLYSTYLGGRGGDSIRGLAVDPAGNAFVTGFTASDNFPVRTPFQSTFRSGIVSRTDAFVSKLNPAGSALLYSTFLGGAEDDLGMSLALDAAGNAYVTGITYSRDFPVQSPLQPRNAGSADAFVAKLNPAGSSLLYSTYLGGESDDFGLAIAVDNAGAAHLTGATGSSGFPLVTPAQPKFGASNNLGFDAFVSKLNPAGSALAYSTFLGGGGVDLGHAIVLSADGSAIIAGETDSPDFPSRNPVRPGGAANDGFLARLSPSGASFEYSTLLGGQSLDSAASVAIDASGNVYVAGTSASRDHPATPGAAQTLLGGRSDAFALKIAPGISPAWLTVRSAASLSPDGTLAPDSIASAFGPGLSPRTEVAPTPALPTALAGVSVSLRDSVGVTHSAALYFVSAGQVNFVVPAAAAPGLAQVSVLADGQLRASGTLRIEPVAPALFTANSNGSGPPAAIAIRTDASGNQTQVPLFACGAVAGTCTAPPISVTDPLYLTLFGTGIRGRTTLAGVRLTVAGVDIPVAYAGAQSEYPGFDQVNAGPLPAQLAARGTVQMVLQVDGKPSNAVTLQIR